MQELIITIVVCFIAGAGAGIGTGFAGMSAAAVISPMLMTFLGIPAYQAVGIALASDVLASAVSAYTYKKNDNLDVKNGLIMMASVMFMTAVASVVAKYVPNGAMSSSIVVAITILGIKFIIFPTTKTKEYVAGKSKKRQTIESIICGLGIGSVCGFVGAGGGMMMLFILTSILGYELKTAVGTSVFIMSFTALTGAVSHFIIGGVADYFILALCIIFTFMWARIAAKIANKFDNKTLNRATGCILLTLGVVVTIVNAL